MKAVKYQLIGGTILLLVIFLAVAGCQSKDKETVVVERETLCPTKSDDVVPGKMILDEQAKLVEKATLYIFRQWSRPCR